MPAHDLTALAHEWIAAALEPGGCAIDATAGAGGDTLFLARAVGPCGRVEAFDIQPRAIERTRGRLRAAGLDARVRLHLACHSRAPMHLPERPAAAVMFNLGWLPGGPASPVTRPETTTAALDALLPHLGPGGRLSVIAYRGHAGGATEERAVRDWTDNRSALARLVLERAGSASPHAPVLRVVERA